MYTEDYLPYDDGIDEGRMYDPDFPDELKQKLNDDRIDDFDDSDDENDEEDDFYA